MKNISDNLKNLLKNDYLKLVKCFKIILKSNEIIGLTEYSKDINIDNITYKYSEGFSEIGNNFASDLSNDNSEIMGLINNETIKVSDILSGKFDNAIIEIFYVNIDDINLEKILITKGNITSTKILDNKIYFNITNILNVLDKTIGDIYSPLCRATFCDNKCSLNANNYTFDSKITEVKSDTEFLCNNINIANKNKDYFKYGILIFTSGKNINQSMEIKQSFDNNIVLNTKLSYKLMVGDTFKITAGCNKSIDTCSNVFNNTINFRGEPYIASTNKVYKFY